MVQHDEIAILEVEAVQLVAGALGVHDIFVDDEGGAFGVCRDALADLAEGAEFAEEVEEVVGADVVGEVLDEEGAG